MVMSLPLYATMQLLRARAHYTRATSNPYHPKNLMKRIYTATIDYTNVGVRIERRFPSHSLCRRYMAARAGELQFLHGYRVLEVSRLGDVLVGIRLSDGTEHVVISFSREA